MEHRVHHSHSHSHTQTSQTLTLTKRAIDYLIPHTYCTTTNMWITAHAGCFIYPSSQVGQALCSVVMHFNIASHIHLHVLFSPLAPALGVARTFLTLVAAITVAISWLPTNFAVNTTIAVLPVWLCGQKL